MQKVTCIIVTYNASKLVFNCLSSINEKKIDLQIVVIDNNSKDDTLKVIAENFPDVLVCPQSENLGFGAANNLGFEKAKEYGSEYVYLLNQDTVSYPDNIFNLVQLDLKVGKKSGFLTPTHLNDDGTRLDRVFESFITAETSPRLISDILLTKTKELYQIEFSNAAAWLLRISTIEDVGGLFSKAFFHYGEDNNFVSRLKYHNYENYIAPKIFIHHCREVRKGKLSSKFQSKRHYISAVVKMHDINYSYLENSLFIFKKSLSLASRFKIMIGLKLFLYPILSFNEISKTRKSYLTKKIL